MLNTEKIARSSEKHYEILSRMSKARNARYVQSENEAKKYVKKSHLDGVNFTHISPRMETAGLIHKESAKKYKKMKEKMKKLEKHDKIRRDKRKKFFNHQDRSSLTRHKLIRRKRTMRLQITFDEKSFKRAGFGKIFKMKMSTNFFEEVDYLLDVGEKFEETLNLGHLDRPNIMKFIIVLMRQRTTEELQQALRRRRNLDSNDKSLKILEKFEGDRDPIIEDEEEDVDSVVENSRTMAREFTLMPKKDDVYWTIFGMKKVEVEIFNGWTDLVLLDPRIEGKKGKVKFKIKVF